MNQNKLHFTFLNIYIITQALSRLCICIFKYACYYISRW